MLAWLHLHSTMFIFIFTSRITASTADVIYIPLCLYLYHRKIFVVDIAG